MNDNVSRMIGTVGIWISFAITMAFGICRMNFSGETALPAFLLSVAMVCGAAALATRAVWRNPASPFVAERAAERTTP